MNIISSPWIAVDLGSDRIHVAYLESDREVRSVLPENGEFDSLFHVSPNSEIRFGRGAAEYSQDDPNGFVLPSACPLRDNETIRFADGRPPTKPSILFAVLLQRVRQYCEEHIFSGEPLVTCVLALPHRSNRLRRTYARIAEDAGFTEIHFRDMAVSAEAVRQHTWGEAHPYMTVCNLGASQVSFTLLKCQHGGSERIARFHSYRAVGVDEIDRIILQSADPGHIAPTDSHDALAQLKSIRMSYALGASDHFHFFLHGKKKRVRTAHFEAAARIFLQKVLACFKIYVDKSSEVTGIDDIPILLVGGGANNPLISQAIESATSGKVYWWAEAEEAAAQGAAMAFMPKTLPPTPTEEEKRFYQRYEDAAMGDPVAQCDLAQMLETGTGTIISLEEAFDWYRLAARNGSPDGKFGLARFLFHGLGIPRDVDTSVQLLRESAEAGYAPSQFSLAMFLFQNNPGADEEADTWLYRAAEQRYAEALAFMERRSSPIAMELGSSDWQTPAEVDVDE